MTNTHTQNGFTLIELMIVVAIIGIISAVALPAYNSHIQKSNIKSAQSLMLSLAQQLERCYFDQRSYSGANCPSGSVPTENGVYEVSVVTENANLKYEITAQTQKPYGNCSQMKVEMTGAKSPQECW